MWSSVHRHFCILTEDVEDTWIIFGFLLPNWSSCNTGVEKGLGQNCLVPQEKLILYWKLRPRTDLLPQDHLYVLGKEDSFKGTEFILCRKGREEEQKTALHHGYDVSLILEVGKSKSGKVVSHQSYWNAWCRSYYLCVLCSGSFSLKLAPRTVSVFIVCGGNEEK